MTAAVSDDTMPRANRTENLQLTLVFRTDFYVTIHANAFHFDQRTPAIIYAIRPVVTRGWTASAIHSSSIRDCAAILKTQLCGRETDGVGADHEHLADHGRGKAAAAVS